jgi:hypothetical protein
MPAQPEEVQAGKRHSSIYRVMGSLAGLIR